MNTPKCSTCEDTGHSNPEIYDMDCTDCDVASQRYALNKFASDKRRESPDIADLYWAIHQRALAMAPKQEPVAYLKFWAARSWGGSGNNDIEYAEGLCVCEKGEIGDDKLPAFPVYAAPAVANGALTDEQIVAICEKECGWLAGAKDEELVKLARAILAGARGTA